MSKNVVRIFIYIYITKYRHKTSIMAVFLININNVLHIHDEVNHDPLMVAHQTGVRLLIYIYISDRSH